MGLKNVLGMSNSKDKFLAVLLENHWPVLLISIITIIKYYTLKETNSMRLSIDDEKIIWPGGNK